MENGSYASYNWKNLEQATTYNWYVNISDSEGLTTRSNVWNFTTFNYTLTKCKELNFSGNYILGKNITNGTSGIKGSCFNITVEDIILDGNDYVIKGDKDNEGKGIYSNNHNNIIIKDFKEISGFSRGIALEKGFNNSIINNKLLDNFQGMYFNNVNDSVITNNWVDEEKGVNIVKGSGNAFYFNAFFNGSFYFINNSGIGNEFNTTLNGNPAGNYYSNILDYDVYDSNNDGYADYGLDYPYNNSTGRWIGGGEDYGPIVPYFILNSPVNGKSFGSGTSSVLLNFSIKDIERKNYNLTVYKKDNTGLCNKSNVSGNSFVNCSWTGLSNGNTYEWSVNASIEDYTFSSPEWNFKIKSVEEEDGGTGGGGGGGTGIVTGYWTSTMTVSDEDFSQGFDGERGERQRFRVNVDGEQHHVGVVNVDTERERITINVSSETQQAILSIGDVRKFEVNGDGYYDVWVRLNGINRLSGKGLFTIRAIHEEISPEPEEEPEEKEPEEPGKNETKGEEVSEEEEEKDYSWIWVVVAITIILIVVIISIIKKRQKSVY